MVSAKWNNGLQEVVLKAEKDCVLRVKNSFDSESVIMQTGGSEQVVKAQDDFLTVSIRAGVAKIYAQKN